MESISVLDFIINYKIHSDDAFLYVIKNDNNVLYVGKSEGIKGVVDRLDHHLWLNRRANGNYILIRMPKENDKLASIVLEGFIKEKQTDKEEIVYKVRTHGMNKMVSLYLKKYFYWSTPDKLGRYILERIPQSLDWIIDFYDSDDLGFKVRRKGLLKDTQIDVLIAEKLLIESLRPQINTQHN